MARLCVAALVVAGLLVAQRAPAEAYIAFTAAGGGRMPGYTWGGEAGWLGPFLSLGVGLDGQRHQGQSECANCGSLDTSKKRGFVPVIGVTRTGPREVEGYALIGIALAPQLVLAATLGSSTVTRDLQWSTQGTPLRTETQEPEVRFRTYSLQLQLRPTHQPIRGLLIGAGYHNRRGVVGRIGYAFSLHRLNPEAVVGFPARWRSARRDRTPLR